MHRPADAAGPPDRRGVRPAGGPALRVAFVLARAAPRPVGALKVVYRHADALARHGHEVTLIHPERPVWHPDGPPPDRLTPDAAPGSDPHPWYRTDPRVRSLLLADLAPQGIDGTFDLVVAATWQVMPAMAAYPARLGRRVLFLQDYESYRRPDGSASAAIRAGLRAGWPVVAGSLPVQRLVERVTGTRCPLVACAVDASRFGTDLPAGAPERCRIGFPARPEWSKRTGDAVDALTLLRARRDRRIDAWCFGRYDARLPGWIAHHAGPSDAELRRLYNETSVFVVPSWYEGFGLPGAEAMACGAALVSTRNDGVDAYAVHGESALLCPVGDPPALARAVARLMDDPALRARIAAAGTRSVAARTWPQAAREFEACLRRIAARG